MAHTDERIQQRQDVVTHQGYIQGKRGDSEDDIHGIHVMFWSMRFRVNDLSHPEDYPPMESCYHSHLIRLGNTKVHLTRLHIRRLIKDQNKNDKVCLGKKKRTLGKHGLRFRTHDKRSE